MYFNPSQNNHNNFYHPLNEEVKTIDKKKAKDIYDKLKKGSEIEVDFGNSMTRGGKPITLKVTNGHRVVGASKVGRIILVDKENPRGMKYKLFDRDGSVSLAQSDMGTILRDMKIVKEGVEELEESTVDTSHYRSDHGKRPNPNETGGWSFSDKKFGKEFYMSPNKMPYKDAKAEAAKIAKEKGFSKIYLAASYHPEFADDNVQIDEEKKLDSRGLGVTRQSGLGSKKVNGEKARKVLTSAKVPHDMVMGTIRVPERFVRIAKEKLDDAFGGMFQKKTGFKVSGTMKEDVQLDEAEEVIVNFRFDNRSDAIAFGHQAKKQGLALRAKEFGSQGKQTSHLAVDGDKLRSLYFDYAAKLKKLAKKYMGKYSTTDGDKNIDKMMREDVQLDEERGTKIKVMVKGDENVYERMTRALMYARLPGYEGATFNKRKGMTTYAFDAKNHTGAVRKKFAKIIQTHNGEFVQSIEEGFASDAQRRAAFASGYKAKGKKKNEEEEVEEGLRQAMSDSRETPAQKRKRQEKDNFDLYKKRQGRISALRGDKSSRQLTPKQQRDYLKRVNLDQIRAMEDVDMQNVTASQLRAIKEAKVYRTLNNLRKGEENGE
jgi:hypothetical protein